MQVIHLYLGEDDFEQLFHLQGVLILFGETRSIRWDTYDLQDFAPIGSSPKAMKIWNIVIERFERRLAR